MMIDTDMTPQAAFELGYDAHDDGFRITDCPAHLTDAAKEAWTLGWTTAQDSLLALEDRLREERYAYDDMKDWDD